MLSIYVSIWHTADGRSALPLADIGAGKSWVLEVKPTNIFIVNITRNEMGEPCGTYGENGSVYRKV
jgi:hypothetical protein